jgi:hypothetical protein
VKALFYTRYGPPEVLQLKEMEKPVPRDNELLHYRYSEYVRSAVWRSA